MARIQILELPEGPGDDRPPFILVVDEYVPQRYITAGGTEFKTNDPFEGVAEKIGARAVLVFEEAIEIPANDVPVGPDGYPIKIRIEGDFEQFREQVQDEIAQAQTELAAALNANRRL